MNNHRKLLALLLALTLVVLLAACGGEKTDDPNAGTWNGVTVSMLGIEMDIVDIFPGGIQLELKGNGKGNIIVEGDSSRIQWSCENGQLTVGDSSVTMSGTIEGSVLTLQNLLGTGMDIVFEKE